MIILLKKANLEDLSQRHADKCNKSSCKNDFGPNDNPPTGN